MANRLLSNRIYSHKKDIKIAHAKVAIGATGAPTLDTTASKGILSVSRSAAGKYLFTFGVTQNGQNMVDLYKELLGVTVFIRGVGGTVMPIAPIWGVVNEAIATAGTLELWFEATVAGGAIELGNGETINAQFFFGDSSAP